MSRRFYPNQLGASYSGQRPPVRLVPQLLLLLLLLWWSSDRVVDGASGWAAHSLLLLKNFDVDEALQEWFYNAPNGSLLTLTRDGYDIIDLEHRTGSGPAPYAAPWHLSTAAVYRGSDRTTTANPMRCRLSDEWVVLQKDLVSPSGKGGNQRLNSVLLHCRLPLPQSLDEMAMYQQAYIDRHEEALSAALENWWLGIASEYRADCLYGNGEGSLTGAARYYILCPNEGMYIVQHVLLEKLIAEQPKEEDETISDSHLGQKRRSGPRLPAKPHKRKEKDDKVLNFLVEMHSSRSSRHETLQSSLYGPLFQLVGTYHPLHSKPHWNDEDQVWELWLPSLQHCDQHFMYENTSAENTTTNSSGQEAIYPEDMFWKTVVQFHCPTKEHFSSPDSELLTKELSRWSITEVRQLCQYHVDIRSSLVCGWEQELDSFRVNPIPCVLV